MSASEVQTLIEIALGVAALGAFIWRRTAPIVTLAVQLHGDDGDPKRGILPRPGVLERLTTTESAVATMQATAAMQAAQIADLRAMVAEVVGQMRNNGGSTMMDKVDKTLEAVTNTYRESE